jgi:aminoglycoside N3'-acetyltransferase
MIAPVTREHIQQGIHDLGLSGQPVCVHSSLRSFGNVEGGPRAVVEGLLAEGCTVLVPSFSSDYGVPPPPDQRPARNGWDYVRFPGHTKGIGRIYTPEANEIDPDLGVIPGAVVAWPGRARGSHSLCSFAAIGPVADELVADQAPSRVYAPLEKLAELGGSVILMGVGLDSLTLLHLAEQQAGRRSFRRWANGPDGRPMMVEYGGCSDGFPKLEPILAPLARETRVGQSRWRAFPAQATLATAAEAIRSDPSVTHCDNPTCERCNDAVAGGPILDGDESRC